MTKIFTPAWLECYKQAWNADTDLVGGLARLGFDARIGYGYPETDSPSVVVHINDGRIEAAGPYAGEPLDWDLRASGEDWDGWMSMPPGLLALSVAYTEHRLRFRRGSYASVIKNPRLAHPFVRSFAAMSAAAHCRGGQQARAGRAEQHINSLTRNAQK